MECAEFRAALVSQGDSPQLAAHAAACPECAHSLIALAATVSRVEGSQIEPELSDSALRTVQGALTRERGARAWLRSRTTRWRTGFVIGCALVFVGLFAVLEPRVDIHSYPLWRLALIALVYALAIAALVRSALLPLHRLPARGRDRLLLGIALGLPFALSAIPAPTLHESVSLAGQGRDCISVGLLLGLSFFAALTAVDRDRRPGMHTRWLALAGASLTANLALLFHCPIPRPAHGVIVHAGIVPALMALALLIAVGTKKLWSMVTRVNTA